jgi:hypothetical protein
VAIPYLKGISEKFRHTGDKYNIRTAFKTKRSLCNLLVNTRPQRDLQDNIFISALLPVKMAGAVFVKQVDHFECVSVTTEIISNKS